MICSVKPVWEVLLPVKAEVHMGTEVPLVELDSLKRLIWVTFSIPSLGAGGQEGLELDSLGGEVHVVEDELVQWQVTI